jgi:hypothetical protein
MTELGYGLGTAAGILTWNPQLGNVGPFRSALGFAAASFAVTWVADLIVVGFGRAKGIAEADPTEHLAADFQQWDRRPAVTVMRRWAAIVPLTTVAVQIAVMLQTDRPRFADFFSYMSFDIGTVVAGMLLIWRPARFRDSPFVPPEYLPADQKTFSFGINSWLGACSLAMLLAYAFEATHIKLGECLAYGLAGLIYEALWATLLGWLGAAANEKCFDVKRIVSITIGSAILGGAAAYFVMSMFSWVHPAWLTIVAMAIAFMLVRIPANGLRQWADPAIEDGPAA